LNTVIACVVAPFDHIYVPPGEDVSITESPKQKVVGPLGVMVGGAGMVLTVTAVGALVALHPLVVSVTVYEPVIDAMIDWVVSPFDHK